MSTPEQVVKRDGTVVPFDEQRIEQALFRCLNEAMPQDVAQEQAAIVTGQVLHVVQARYLETIPTVEHIQDVVETCLQATGLYDAARRYIRYRLEHEQQRQNAPITLATRAAFQESARYFPDPTQQVVYYDKYARYNYELGRRETWVETVRRTVEFLRELSQNRLEPSVYKRIEQAILTMRAMPAMRLLATAGDAARRNNISIFNCSYLEVESIDAFVEALIISMSGCGVGYSVERECVEQFPRIIRQTGHMLPVYTVEDTAEGWAAALRLGLETWFTGSDIRFDYSAIRPAGAPLRTKGGRASGPAPLKTMLDFCRQRIIARQGTCLRTVDAHDMMCAVGNAAVSGGHRRTAMLALFSHDDQDMLSCKAGDFDRDNSQRWNANNSAVWSQTFDQEEVARFVLNMTQSKRGEPGIASRLAANATRPERRAEARFGLNPCGEILLRPGQFCNLTNAIARENSTEEDLLDAVEIATIIGTIQAMATHFPGLRSLWGKNCEEERLLGVSLDGQMDSVVAQDPDMQRRLRDHAVAVNAEYASLLGINQAAAVTCVKPSGNSSMLLNCSFGLHARWSPFYIRNIRIGTTSAIYKILRDAGVPMDPESGQRVEDAITWVAHFPMRSPVGAPTRKDRSAVQQCDYWLQVKQNYTEHNPSVTITYQPDEVLDIMRWIYDHQDSIGGMAFLPADNLAYDQPPFEEITEAEYTRRMEAFPKFLDFAKLVRYETSDLTTAAQELACSAGLCEV